MRASRLGEWATRRGGDPLGSTRRHGDAAVLLDGAMGRHGEGATLCSGCGDSGSRRGLVRAGAEAPEDTDRQRVEAWPEGHGFGSGVEQHAAMETLAGRFGQEAKAAEVVRSDGCARFDLDADEPAATRFEHEVNLLASGGPEVKEVRLSCTPGRLLANLGGDKGLEEWAGQPAVERQALGAHPEEVGCEAGVGEVEEEPDLQEREVAASRSLSAIFLLNMVVF